MKNIILISFIFSYFQHAHKSRTVVYAQVFPSCFFCCRWKKLSSEKWEEKLNWVLTLNYVWGWLIGWLAGWLIFPFLVFALGIPASRLNWCNDDLLKFTDATQLRITDQLTRTHSKFKCFDEIWCALSNWPAKWSNWDTYVEIDVIIYDAHIIQLTNWWHNRIWWWWRW